MGINPKSKKKTISNVMFMLLRNNLIFLFFTFIIFMTCPTSFPGDIKSDQDGMSETFYLSNIVPQDYGNNGGFWYRMEVYCRTLAKRYDGVYVVSGPLFKPEKDDNGKKFLKFQVIYTFC